ncbi:MAG TPA: substrate-binding domain-containing protein [Ktedonobacterales bacterium]
MTSSSARVGSVCLSPASRVKSPAALQVIHRFPWFFFALLLLPIVAGCGGLPGGIGANATPGSSHLLITSSPALLPLVRTAAALYERQHPEAQIDLRSSENVDGLSDLVHQQADIAATIVYADPAAISAEHMLDQLVCIVPFFIIAHPDVSLPSLSREQIRGIFSTGAITNWKQLGGPDQKLVALMPPLTSDIRFLFREEALGAATEVGTTLPTDSPETLRDMVARTPGSISYLPGPLLNARVRAVAIDGEPATAEQILAGRYAFWSFAHLYTRDTGAAGMQEATGDSGIRALFLHFMQTTSVEQLIQQLGYIPLTEMDGSPISASPAAFTTSA